jgi:hypothetical protein
MLGQRIIDLLYTFSESTTRNQDVPNTLSAGATEGPSHTEKQTLDFLARKFLRPKICSTRFLIGRAANVWFFPVTKAQATEGISAQTTFRHNTQLGARTRRVWMIEYSR